MGVSQSVAAVDHGTAPVIGVQQRLGRALQDRNIGTAHGFKQAQGVGGRGLDAAVAEDGGKGQKLDFRRGVRQEEGHRIVHAGIGIVNDAVAGFGHVQ